MTDEEAFWTGIVIGSLMKQGSDFNYTVMPEVDQVGNYVNWFYLRSDSGSVMKISVSQVVAGLDDAREQLLAIEADLSDRTLD